MDIESIQISYFAEKSTKMNTLSNSYFFNSTANSARKHKQAALNSQKDNKDSNKKAKNAFLTYSNKKMRDLLQLSKKRSTKSTKLAQDVMPTSQKFMGHKIKSFTSTGSTASSSSSSTTSSVCSMEVASFKSKLKRKLFAKPSVVNILKKKFKLPEETSINFLLCDCEKSNLYILSK
jgi:hypothetical protein